MIYQLVALVCAGHVWGWWIGFLVFSILGMFRFVAVGSPLWKLVAAEMAKTKK